MIPQRTVQQTVANDGWLMTFGDLIGILVALFVLIYATSDQRADRFSRAVISLSQTLKGTDPIQADLSGPYGYQVALLERSLEALPQWTLTDHSPRYVSLSLKDWSLENAIGDGLWLESLERFGKPISMTMTARDQAAARQAALAAERLKFERTSLGLTTPWSFEIRTKASLGTTQVEVKVALDGQAQTISLAPQSGHTSGQPQ